MESFLDKLLIDQSEHHDLVNELVGDLSCHFLVPLSLFFLDKLLNCGELVGIFGLAHDV